VLINFDHLSFSYPKTNKLVLEDFSMEIKKGDHLVLKGASGAGKTTLLRLILGFDKPTEGNIYYQGRELTNSVIHTIRRECAWLPQDLNLGEGPVKEVFGFPFSFKVNSGIKPETDEIFKIFDRLNLLPEIWESNFRDLSTGQRQRVGIALCYLLNKPILLMDEPTSALDVDSRQKAAELLLAKNKTIISTSHDSWWIDRCNKIVEI